MMVDGDALAGPRLPLLEHPAKICTSKSAAAGWCGVAPRVSVSYFMADARERARATLRDMHLLLNKVYLPKT